MLLGDVGEKLDSVNAAIDTLQTELIACIGDEVAEERIGNEILALKDEHQELMTKVALQEEVNGRIEELIAYLKMMPQEIKEYSDELVRGLLEKIIVKEESLVIVFKSGTEIEIETE